ncbi:hypothetical protein GYMLUDRAFT_73944 [Collybiopsis luxurians FD-317 M1]|uniref:Uncharacterized protein n=1 Tax=Collybiopsis luxurians FD-317 M1 TaxID=944289 RepID=A0A0D0CNX0_9AGAR|nr:hypothetical protein GYMLUDRAFT_73944 [Collybiopsis luxurians FD-317 M1]
MRPDGYALAEDVLRAVPFGRMTVDDLVATSKMDPEARTQVKKLRAKQWWIRAAGKHSIDFVSTGWKEIEQPHELDQIVYLTESSEWESIRYRGLKRAQNEYFIRLRQNIPENFGYSGEGRSAAIVIYIDIQNAMEQGLTFFVNRDNEVILDVDCIPPMFFQKVERVRWSKDILLGSSANDEAQSLT